MAKKPPAGVHPVRVFSASSTTEANLVIGFLDEKGIPARIENALTGEALSGVDLMLEGRDGLGIVVSSSDEAGALAALAEYRARPPLGDEERVEEE